jgi:hypothetical protein
MRKGKTVDLSAFKIGWMSGNGREPRTGDMATQMITAIALAERGEFELSGDFY